MYQLKSSKCWQLVLEALKEKGFLAKNVINIINRNKKPQPLFKFELEPKSRAFKKSTPIYKMQSLLHRRITVEEPHKRNGLLQCTNCQEYGHTKNNCGLRSVCVACGGFHNSEPRPTNK